MNQDVNRVEMFETESVSRDFIEFCKKQDDPRFSYRYVPDLYFRSVGYTSRSVPEVDREILVEDLRSHVAESRRNERNRKSDN